GAKVIGTASSSEKAALLITLGAEPRLYKEEMVPERVKALTGGHGADVVLDMVGGSAAADNLRLAAPGGRIVTIALQGGTAAESSIGGLLVKQLTWRGMMLRPRPIAVKRRYAKAVREKFWILAENSAIEPIIDHVAPLAEVNDLLARLKRYGTTGKLVIQM